MGQQLERLERLERCQPDALAGAAHLLGSGHDRFDDFLLARAAANVAVHEML